MVFVQNWLYSGSMVVFEQKRLYSCKSYCIWEKMVVFGQKWLYSGKVVVFGQTWLYLGKNGCIRANLVALRGKMVVLKEKWL